MKGRTNLMAAVGIVAGCTQSPTLTIGPADLPAPSPLITDCAADYRERGRPNERPVDSGPDARAAIDGDLKPNSLAELRAAEPLCFYLLPDERILMRDGRGVEYYFRKISRWQLDRVDIPGRAPSP